MSVQKKPIRLIVATCNNLGMGKDGKMPWSLPSEFQYFLDTTSRVSRPGKMNMMVWGKRNWYSKPDGTIPLPNTLHVVLSTEMTSAPDHAHFLRDDFESAIRLAAEPPLAEIIETIWVIGGTQVYQTAMEHPWCDLLYITDVRAEFQCDVFFPEFDRKLFKLQEEFPGVPSEIKEENGIKYKCQVFKKETADIQ
ncbi:dihydrofolate reductase [Gouania willdenowi]|uniref:dihydrofolate reductase n=1 Tax=Gouania willdenowi TaxID=441366 RepID=A0A8C5GVN1_GOUWI|nr:dihydrofolate reductase-like [Gouania willdenowi]